MKTRNPEEIEEVLERGDELLSAASNSGKNDSNETEDSANTSEGKSTTPLLNIVEPGIHQFLSLRSLI